MHTRKGTLRKMYGGLGAARLGVQVGPGERADRRILGASLTAQNYYISRQNKNCTQKRTLGSLARGGWAGMTAPSRRSAAVPSTGFTAAFVLRSLTGKNGSFRERTSGCQYDPSRQAPDDTVTLSG